MTGCKTQRDDGHATSFHDHGRGIGPGRLVCGAANAASAWVIQATPNPAGTSESYLQGVSCVSPSSCTATGWSAGFSAQGTTLAEAT